MNGYRLLYASLGNFHHMFQLVMGWSDSHTHQFLTRGKGFGDNFPDVTMFVDKFLMPRCCTFFLKSALTVSTKVVTSHQYLLSIELENECAISVFSFSAVLAWELLVNLANYTLLK